MSGLLNQTKRLAALLSAPARKGLAELGAATLHLGLSAPVAPGDYLPPGVARYREPRFDTARCRHTIERRVNQRLVSTLQGVVEPIRSEGRKNG